MAKTVATAARVQKAVKKMEKPKPEKPKAKPKMETELKKKDVKKEDPYFVQEDYQVCRGSCSQVLCFSLFCEVFLVHALSTVSAVGVRT